MSRSDASVRGSGLGRVMMRSCSERAVHLVDLENLLGTARDRTSIEHAWDDYIRLVPVLAGDSIVVGSGPCLASEGWFALPMQGIRRVLGRGIDGADRALVESVDVAHDFSRFATLIIASGDHGFAPLAEAARRRGVQVFIVVGAGALSAQLRSCASRVFHLPPGSPFATECA